MKRIRQAEYKAVVLFFIVTLLGCSPTPDDKTDSGDNEPDMTIGWLHGNCLAVKREIDVNIDHLNVVDLDTKKVMPLQFGKIADNAEECYALLEDRASINQQEGRKFYTVVTNSSVNLAIGIVYSSDKVKSPEQLTDLDGDGKRDTFTSCSTSEGVNFSVWNGEAYKSKLIWSDYYYLGYDSEADCPEIKW